ncbi:two-component sensor histidine kinase [Cloacibacterium rupense]|uniref:histidine kinase n=1 Tax=Cloacibacterium rupense TaxID=517423 RepID=A0ABQ2NH44_9FLAO|nr:HAMP domain-containing sensor histidine kinase [Cloacibacterium rupense]GGP02348.1 two-component sensor histidine kinase [Cloacibacterium rupense]
MRKNLLSKINNWFVFTVLTIIVIGLAVSSNFLINHLREKESERIKSLATAMKYLQDNEDFDSRLNELSLYVINENENIPIIVTDKNKNLIQSKNITDDILKNPEKLKQKISEMEDKYPPFEIQLPNFNNQFVFYDNSDLLNYLRYYPYGLALFIGAYLLFSFWFLRTIKKSDESMLWAGLAKETAHQIGTPLSSMIGWIEIMKLDKNRNDDGLVEINKDINRLKTISERFSKIGSVPELNDLNLKETIQQNFDYLKSRISRKVIFDLKTPSSEVLTPHNRILISWVIENLVKNAVDAMKGEGNLTINLYYKNKNILIDVKDSGSGMSNAQIRNAFKPGYSTKKRGWGLGLSLAKRVIQEYHNGDIKIAESEVGKGTTFRIVLKS